MRRPLRTAQRAEFLFQYEKIRERLAGMEPIGKRVDDWNLCVFRHFVEDSLFVDARDDALHPAFEVPRDIRDGFALAARWPGD